MSEAQDIKAQPEPAAKPKRKHSLTVVTNSELATFRDCPQKHHFVYRERLRPRLRAKPLALGSILHDGLAAGFVAGYSPEAMLLPTSQRLTRQIVAARAVVKKGRERWFAERELVNDNADGEALDAESIETATMLDFMVQQYFEATQSDLNEFRLVAVERPFRVPVRDRLGRARALWSEGVIDWIAYSPEYHQLILGEHKTLTGDPAQLEKRVEMDPQTSGYLYALREMLEAGELKFFGTSEVVPRDAGLGRTIYNGLRKAYPKEPAINKDLHVSAALIDTTAEVYADALARQVHERGLPIKEKQQERLDELRRRKGAYFGRTEYFRTNAEVERWRWETYTDANRIRESDRDETRRTRNAGHCTHAWSMSCVYKQVCLDPHAPELRAEFRVVEDRHTEVVEALGAEGA